MLATIQFRVFCLLVSRLKNVKIKTQERIVLPVVFMGARLGL
jgi:hypothetical protein